MVRSSGSIGNCKGSLVCGSMELVSLVCQWVVIRYRTERKVAYVVSKENSNGLKIEFMVLLTIN